MKFLDGCSTVLRQFDGVGTWLCEKRVKYGEVVRVSGTEVTVRWYLSGLTETVCRSTVHWSGRKVKYGV